MFKRKKQVAPELPSPFRVMVRQTGEDAWVWAIQIRMLSMSRSGTPYYRTLSSDGAHGISNTKEGAYAAASVVYCDYVKQDLWVRETEYFTPTCEWCK